MSNTTIEVKVAELPTACIYHDDALKLAAHRGAVLSGMGTNEAGELVLRFDVPRVRNLTSSFALEKAA
jgi:hypothetical protein